MRKGRGLVDIDIYNKLLEVPGVAEILIENTTNHRYDYKTKKIRVEISEEAWPEVKSIVANWKRARKGKPQKLSKKANNIEVVLRSLNSIDKKQQERIDRIKNLKPGDYFAYKNVGFGIVSYELGSDALEVKNGKLITQIFFDTGMEWTGQTWQFEFETSGLTTSIVLEEEIPDTHRAEYDSLVKRK